MMIVKMKKQKTNKCVIERKIKFEDYKDFLKATRTENKMNFLEKTINVDILKETIKNS